MRTRKERGGQSPEITLTQKEVTRACQEFLTRRGYNIGNDNALALTSGRRRSIEFVSTYDGVKPTNIGTVLCVIDVQGKYTNRHKLIIEIKKLIDEALREGWTILMIEYHPGHSFADCYTTNEIIKQYLNGSATKIIKRGTDGSKEILAELNSQMIEPNKFVLCGRVRNCCVQATFEGLKQNSPLTEKHIAEHACSEI